MRKEFALLSLPFVSGILMFAALLAYPATGSAQIVEGVITNVDLHGEPRHITVRQRNGQEIDIHIHVSSHLNFLDPRDANVSPELSNLRPGMEVRAENMGA